MKNQILLSDSYKFGHHNMLPEGTEAVYSYMESRENTVSPKVLWFGLQYFLKNLTPVTSYDIDEAEEVINGHLGGGFNRQGWERILNKYGGHFPIEVKSLPEGSFVESGIPLMTIENTDDKSAWLTNFLESYFLHSWYTTSVATLSFLTKKDIAQYWLKTCDNLEGLEFTLHDFGYRGVSSDESAMIGGLSHLVNFRGTDTVPAITTGKHFYEMKNDYALSVAATEHSIGTSLGKQGEEQVFLNLLEKYPSGILSIVIDSYDPYNFVKNIVCKHADKIAGRNGKLVLRPDSITGMHKEPGDQVVWIIKELMSTFGYTRNLKEYDELNNKLGVLWGDGIDREGISKILQKVASHNLSVKPLVFGQGGGLLQKINRDTHRFAIKASCQKRNGVWHDIRKETLGKTSRSGKFSVEQVGNKFSCMKLGSSTNDMLKTVYRHGDIVDESFDTIVARANSFFQKELI